MGILPYFASERRTCSWSDLGVDERLRGVADEPLAENSSQLECQASIMFEKIHNWITADDMVLAVMSKRDKHAGSYMS